MARKISDLSVKELEKIIRYTTDPQKLSKVVGQMISKAFDEGFDEGYTQGDMPRRSGFGH